MFHTARGGSEKSTRAAWSIAASPRRPSASFCRAISSRSVGDAVPLSNGNLFSARRAEALFRSEVEDEELRDIETHIVRDVSVGRMAPVVEGTAYFVVAEALTNVVKHAGAQHVSVSLTRKLSGVAAVVEDALVRVACKAS